MSPFSTDHYSESLPAKMIRALGAGPTYYLWSLPRYLRRRRRLGLPFDGRAWINPLREFRPARHHDLETPPAYCDALDALAEVGVRITMPPLRFEALTAAWWSTRDVPGDVIECGAYEGACGLALALLGKLHGIDRRVLMFDTFEGIPAIGEIDGHRQGEFELPPGQVERIRDQAARLGVEDRVEARAGLFADSFAKLADVDLSFAFAHIDANVFEGTSQACAFTLPRMVPGGAVVFDDYNGPFDLGARLAIDLHLRGRGETLQPLAWSSAWLRVEDRG